eukprot:GHVQ01025809.1.p1 GENE.GHVQ01025809.1~~GHVQ01025809.1.p1  ORF type:complete len:325 (-),score=44.65 GHVQ01025809.1:224-1198(-)
MCSVHCDTDYSTLLSTLSKYSSVACTANLPPRRQTTATMTRGPNGEGTKDAGRAVDGGETDGGETEGRNQEESCCMNMLKEHCVKKFWCGDKDILKRYKCQSAKELLPFVSLFGLLPHSLTEASAQSVTTTCTPTHSLPHQTLPRISHTLRPSCPTSEGVHCCPREGSSDVNEAGLSRFHEELEFSPVLCSMDVFMSLRCCTTFLNQHVDNMSREEELAGNLSNVQSSPARDTAASPPGTDSGKHIPQVDDSCFNAVSSRSRWTLPASIFLVVLDSPRPHVQRNRRTAPQNKAWDSLNDIGCQDERILPFYMEWLKSHAQATTR